MDPDTIACPGCILVALVDFFITQPIFGALGFHEKTAPANVKGVYRVPGATVTNPDQLAPAVPKGKMHQLFRNPLPIWVILTVLAVTLGSCFLFAVVMVNIDARGPSHAAGNNAGIPASLPTPGPTPTPAHPQLEAERKRLHEMNVWLQNYENDQLRRANASRDPNLIRSASDFYNQRLYLRDVQAEKVKQLEIELGVSTN